MYIIIVFSCLKVTIFNEKCDSCIFVDLLRTPSVAIHWNMLEEVVMTHHYIL